MAYSRDLAIQENKGLVYKIAKKFYRPGIEFIDLIQEGNMGLLIAADKYDDSFGATFFTYAYHWVYNSIRKFVEKNCRIVHVKKKQEEVCMNTQYKLTIEDIPANCFDGFIRVEFAEVVTSMSNLSARDQAILVSTCVQGHTLEENAKDFGVTKERVRQIKLETIAKLCSSLR